MIGRPGAEHVALRVVARMNPEHSDYWDGNWLRTVVIVHVGAFEATYKAALRTDELSRFRGEVGKLYQTLKGQAHLRSMEQWLDVVISTDGLGNMSITGEARDEPGLGNRLRFTIDDYDQTDLPGLIQALDEALDRFPIIGLP